MGRAMRQTAQQSQFIGVEGPCFFTITGSLVLARQRQDIAPVRSRESVGVVPGAGTAGRGRGEPRAARIARAPCLQGRAVCDLAGPGGGAAGRGDGAGLFTESPHGDAFAPSAIIEVRRERLRSGPQVLTFVVDRKPLFAAIDPDTLFIDRNATDNVAVMD